MKTRLTYFLILTFSTLCGQVPGYMGKHFGAGYQFGFFASPFLNFKPSTKHTLFLDMSAGRKLNIDLTYALYIDKIPMPTKEYINMPSTVPGPYTFDPTASEVPARIQFADLSFNVFPRRFIAPLGSYFIFRMGVCFGEIKGGNQLNGTATYNINYNPSSPIPATVYGKDMYSAGRIGLGFGKRLMIGKDTYVKYSAIAHLFIGEPFEWDNSDSYYVRDYIGGHLGFWTRHANMFELNLGFGYLFL